MDEVLTVEEVARYLRVHPMTVQRWCRTGSLPAAKIGKAYRIKRDDLERWWGEHTAEGAAANGRRAPSPAPYVDGEGNAVSPQETEGLQRSSPGFARMGAR